MSAAEAIWPGWSSWAPAGAQLLVRSAVLGAAVLAGALALGWLLLSRRAAARHAALLLALALAALAPAWLMFGPRAAPGTDPSRTPADDVMRSSDGSAGRLPPAPLAGAAFAARTVTERPLSARASSLVLLLWAAGVVVALGRLGRGLYLAQRIARRARPLDDGLWVSSEIGHAAVVGIWRPRVLVHPGLLAVAPASLAPVLAHERAHVERRDPLWGLCERLLGALAWFNPLLPLLRRSLATAREEACDDAVLARHPGAAYARTLLALAATRPVPARAHLVGVLPSGRALEHRIRRALAAAPTAGPPAPAPVRLVAFVLGLVALGAPLAHALALPPGPARGRAADGPPGLLPWAERPLDREEQAIVASAGAGVNASFVLRELDGATGASVREVILGPELASERVTPASTFKVVIALMALERGLAPDERFALTWNRVPDAHQIPGANQDHTLESAMRSSVNWYFEELLRRLPAVETRRLLVETGYGNAAVDGDPLRYWVSGGLGISPREQVSYLARLHAGALPFGSRTRAILSRITLLEEREGVRLHGKTGTAVGRPWGMLAWLVGHVDNGGRRFVNSEHRGAGRGDRRSHPTSVSRPPPPAKEDGGPSAVRWTDGSDPPGSDSPDRVG